MRVCKRNFDSSFRFSMNTIAVLWKNSNVEQEQEQEQDILT